MFIEAQRIAILSPRSAGNLLRQSLEALLQEVYPGRAESARKLVSEEAMPSEDLRKMLHKILDWGNDASHPGPPPIKGDLLTAFEAINQAVMALITLPSWRPGQYPEDEADETSEVDAEESTTAG